MLSVIALLEALATPFSPAFKVRLHRWAMARQTEQALRRADAKTLADIGVSRFEIKAKAWEDARQAVPAKVETNASAKPRTVTGGPQAHRWA